MRSGKAKLGALVAAVTVATGLAGVVATQPAAAATLQRVTSFGTNPTNLNMYVYVPANVQAKPPILVAVHYCSGSATAFYNGGAHEWVTGADQYGYIIVFPEATRSGSCFDVYSPQALTHNGSSDPQGIMSMITYAEQHYNGDPNRVYVMGASSGAMMTNVLAADYPDVIKAGVAFSGVPATCFATGSTTNTWNSQCSGGSITKTAQQWGDAVRAMYPGYSGPYPRMQLWHGSTDTTLSYHNFGEEIKQWTNLNGVSQTPVSTDSPVSSWTRTRYGNSSTLATVEGISIAGVGHVLPMSGMAAYGIRFMGLDSRTTTTTTTTTRTTTSTTTTRTTTSTTTPATSTTTRSTTTTGSVPVGGCTAAYSVTSSWSGGFVANVNVTAGSAGIQGWKVTLALPSGTAVTSGWNATFTGSTGTVTATNASYNGSLGAGAGTSFGFQGTGSGSGVSATCSAN